MRSSSREDFGRILTKARMLCLLNQTRDGLAYKWMGNQEISIIEINQEIEILIKRSSLGSLGANLDLGDWED